MIGMMHQKQTHNARVSATYTGNVFSAFNIEEQYTDELPQDARQVPLQVCKVSGQSKTRVYSSNGQEVDKTETFQWETLTQ